MSHLYLRFGIPAKPELTTSQCDHNIPRFIYLRQKQI